MTLTLAFDVYGTLINTHGVMTQLKETMGDKAEAFSLSWREKQLEYSFRRGLMQNYAPFSVCTREALDYTCRFHRVTLSDKERQSLLSSYRTLPAFEDVVEGLTELKAAGHRMFAFSNGSEEAIETLLTAAGIRHLFLGVVSVDDQRSFKPNPGVYSHFLRTAGATGGDAWLISSNPFDVIGAISAGMRAAWLQRSPDAIFDPWGIDPTLTVTGLGDLKQALA